MPSEVRVYLQTVNGMAEEYDNEMLRFWTTDELDFAAKYGSCMMVTRRTRDILFLPTIQDRHTYMRFKCRCRARRMWR
jgi:hypothetical protein